MDLMLGFLLAMSVTMALIPPLMNAAARLNILDAPGHRKVHATPVPRVGGIAMAAGVMLALAVSGEFQQPMPAYLAGIAVLLAFGVWDDRVTLSAGPKLIGQVIAVGLVMSWGGVTITTTTLTERYLLPEWLSLPLTAFFLLGVTNAINLADGLDGLAGGTTLLALSALALLAFPLATPFVGVVSIVIIGAILGFLRYNTHPARVFMGDGGSQVLGFSAAVLAMELTQPETTALSTALPLLLLGVPIIDTLMVMTQRIVERRSPFEADRNHIHHRLLALGFDHHEAVLMIYLLQGALFVAAWFLRYESDLTILASFVVTAGATIGLLQVAARTHWHWRQPATGQGKVSRVGSAIRWLRQPGHLPLWALLVAATSLATYFIVVALVCPGPSIDVRIMAAVLGLAMAASLVARWRSATASWFDQAALYVAVVIAVYFDRQTDTALEMHAPAQLIMFAVLVVAIVVRFRLASDRIFRITTLDALIIFVAVVVPNLPGSFTAAIASGETIAKLVALLYGVETMLGAAAGWWRLPSLTALGFLAACALRGAF